MNNHAVGFFTRRPRVVVVVVVAGDRFSLREQVPRVESDSSQREWNDDDVS